MSHSCHCNDRRCMLVQTEMSCPECDWDGRRWECGQDELSEGIVDTCPECGADCEEAA